MGISFGKIALSGADLWKAIHVGIGIVIIVIAAALLRRFATKHIGSSAGRYRARKIISLLAWVAAILLIIAIFSQRFATIGVALGVAGAGIALALKDLFVSMAGWVAISTGEIYRTGDRIQLAGIRGDVIDVSVFRTTLMEIGEWVKTDLYTGRIVRIMNGAVFQDPVFNYSADFPFVWDEFTLPVKYGSDHQLAREILSGVATEVLAEYMASAQSTWKQVARKYLIEEVQVEPMVTLVATDNWIEFTLRYIVDYKRRRITKHQLFTRILDKIEKTEGRVQIASGTYAIVQVPPLEIREKPEMLPPDRRSRAGA